jgi:phosphoglycerate dehydrogenase-like enzyme
MKKVVFFNGQSNEVAEIVRTCMPQGFAQGFELHVHPSSLSEAEKAAVVSDVDFLLLHPAEMTRPVLQNAKKLRHIQLLTAGYDKVDIDAARQLGVTVATNGGANAWAVAEHTVALLLTLYKRLVQCDRSVRAGTWRKPITGLNTFELAGKTVGLIGLGNIGSKVARRLQAFETRIMFLDGRATSAAEFGGESVSLDTLLKEADVLSIHVPLTSETRGMIGAAELAKMKPSAVLINTSRAEVVDEDALEAAIRSGQIAGAGLDVFRQEPVPTSCGLLTLDNVVLSPHTAGHSYEAWFRRASFSWDNIQRVASGEAPISLAN